MSRQRAAPDLIEDETGSSRGILAMLGGAVAANPSLAGGGAAFAVIFGFVATNALWHQPGHHPAPILKTRELAAPAAPQANAVPATRAPSANGVPARSVTTFRIERSDGTPTASIPVPDLVAAPAEPAVAAGPVADPVLLQIQTILVQNGLYDGEIDGLMGPKSAAAIRAWEQTNGYSQTGEATAALLAIMQAVGGVNRQAGAESADAAAPPTPRPRPAPVVAADSRVGEPVTVPAAIDAAASELVRQIQSGLSNIAYADISVDGVAGSQTRAAIGAFEKHYRLPVTGEPNEAVLDKLLEIGAL